ncbi:Shikimate dehydrogenase (NADP(+)) [bacterium HR25]|jgi:shikimate dehydrogenase|nr:Shikimate dehydrogenase (NADP(+)) [bacterium HR25]
MTKRLGVIGYPLGHSLSPVFQQAALDALGIDARYERWETPPERLPEVVASLRQADCLGANVTVPYKEAVIPLLDELEEVARQAGAVNTIVNRGGRLSGHNTDVAGFLQALHSVGFQPRGCAALVLGAGGAARAVVLALLRERAAWVTVTNRTYHRAFRLVEELRPLAGRTVLTSIPMTFIALHQANIGWDLIVNCTVLGMPGTVDENKSPLPAEFIPEDALVFDLVYGPRPTKLLQDAAARGARTLDGLPMLVYQGAESFRLWTGLEPPLEAMMQAARQALQPVGAQGGP